MSDVTHLDRDKGNDIVFYQNLVMKNYVRILAELSADYAALAAEHDEWVARLQQEAKHPPQDEEARLWRIRSFLNSYDEFELRLSELDHYFVSRVSEDAGRYPPGTIEKQRERLSASQPRPQPRPQPPDPEWVDDGNGGLCDVHDNYEIRRKRCATAHLEYYVVCERHDDQWFHISDGLTLDHATELASLLRGSSRSWPRYEPSTEPAQPIGPPPWRENSKTQW